MERSVSAIGTYASTSTSEVVNYFNYFPLLDPRSVFDTLSTLTIVPVIGHNVACQSDDFIFTVQLEATGSANLDLQYCTMISINIPVTTIADYLPLNSDCVEHPTSDIEVDVCMIDTVARTIFVQIVPGIYSNGMKIVVKTKNHAIRNPCTFWSSAVITLFQVFFYSKEGISPSTSSLDEAYMTINASNMNPFPLTYQLEAYTATSYFTFDWITTPHERYYN